MVHLLIRDYLVDVFVANAYNWIVYVNVSRQGLRWMRMNNSPPLSVVRAIICVDMYPTCGIYIFSLTTHS